MTVLTWNRITLFGSLMNVVLSSLSGDVVGALGWFVAFMLALQKEMASMKGNLAHLRLIRFYWFS